MRPDTFTNTEADAAAYERLRGRDEWIDDRPSAAELAEDDYWLGRERDAEWWGEPLPPDPWGDVGPVHHPTRLDLPVPVDPPF